MEKKIMLSTLPPRRTYEMKMPLDWDLERLAQNEESKDSVASLTVSFKSINENKELLEDV